MPDLHDPSLPSPPTSLPFLRDGLVTSLAREFEGVGPAWWSDQAGDIVAMIAVDHVLAKLTAAGLLHIERETCRYCGSFGPLLIHRRPDPEPPVLACIDRDACLAAQENNP